MNFGQVVNKSAAVENQVRLIMETYFPEAVEKESYYHFRCNICGDSQKSRRKKRGYILRNKWIYYCHNCNVSMPVDKWMKQYFPSNYRMYIQAILTSDIEEVETKPIKTKKEVDNIEKKNASHFVPILKGDGSLFKIAREFCENRRIPESIWHKWFVATGGAYKNRIIIPFFDDKGKIYFYQGRALYKWMEPKYMARQGNELNVTYNDYNVDSSKPVICVEGAIDSMFVENSIAVSGLRVNDVNGYYFLLDNDKPGKKKSEKLLKKGEWVFLWKKYLEFNPMLPEPKDINDAILATGKEKFTFEELKPFFTKSIFDSVWLMI